MSTLYVALDGNEEAIIASDSRVIVHEGDSRTHLDGFFKVFPLGHRCLAGFIGDYLTAQEIVRDLWTRKKPPSLREAAEAIAKFCEPLSGQKRLRVDIIGVEGGKLTYYKLEGFEYVDPINDAFSKLSDPVIAHVLDQLQQIPYRIEAVQARENGLFYSMTPGGPWMDPLVEAALSRGVTLRQLAPAMIRAIADASHQDAHNDDAEVWILPKEGRARKVEGADLIDVAND